MGGVGGFRICYRQEGSPLGQIHEGKKVNRAEAAKGIGQGRRYYAAPTGGFPLVADEAMRGKSISFLDFIHYLTGAIKA